MSDQEGSRGPMLFYTPQVIDHFTNPRNVGELAPEDTDGYACIGDPGCGDEMKLWIQVREGRIQRIAFKSYGCPGAISTSSMLTELASGLSVEEASRITDDDVVNALGGIPENKKHCSLLGVQALQAALASYHDKRQA
ncbi:MAG TPA: iron-sulfur cluster assembly scaffold protein [Spirochaetales bacterium]|nr:iron-sulfur cluster assembly scaffold protein [Spirochaetales bacterium]